MWYLTLISIIICFLYVFHGRYYLRRKWERKNEKPETHLSVKQELGTWDENRKVFLNIGTIIAFACAFMAFELHFEVKPYKITIDEPIDPPYQFIDPISIKEPPPPPKPKELKPEPPPPPPLVITKVVIVDVEPPPPAPKPVVVKVEPPEDVNPVMKKPVIKKVKEKKKKKPIPPPPPPRTKPYEKFELDEEPSFPGGYAAMEKFIRNNVVYSARCREIDIQGRVFVRFVIDENGLIKDAKLAKGLDCAIDDEAVKVIKKLPKWNPGMKQNKAVPVNMVVPINFQLE